MNLKRENLTNMIIFEKNINSFIMITKKVSESSISKNVHQIDARMLYDKETAQAVHLELKPGESLKRHITPVDVFFFVLEGIAEVEVGEEKQRVEANTLVESPKDIVHCIANKTDAMVRVLVVKAPRPTAATRVL